MAAYPDTGRRHRITPVNSRRLDISDAGTVRGIDFGDGIVYEITIEHPYITEAQQNTLEAFYTTNKNASNTITLDGTAYSVQFAGPYSAERHNPTYRTLTARLYGTRV